MTLAPQSAGGQIGQADDCDADHCITCGDVAEPLQVVRVDHQRALALCQNDSGARETVEIALVPPVAEGDELLVHAGTAIAHLGVAQ